MRYRISQYAEALHDALEGKGPDARRAIARHFARLLARHRIMGKAGAILAVYEKISFRRNNTRKVKIESPGPVSEHTKKEIRDILGTKVHFEEIENPALLAGVKILLDEEILIDASGVRQMESMLKKSRS